MGFIGVTVEPPSRYPPRKKVTIDRLLETVDGLAELHELIDKIDCTRARQRKCVSAIESLLDDEPALLDLWREFQRSGGVTVGDFEKFVTRYYRGKVTVRAVPRRDHLRLVVSHAPEMADTETTMSR